MYVSMVNTHSYKLPLGWGWADLTSMCQKPFVAPLEKGKLDPERLLISSASAAFWLQKHPSSFPWAHRLCWQPEAIFITQILAVYDHTLSAYVAALSPSCAGFMENVIKSVLQLSQVKRPHLKPDSVYISYLSRVPWVYHRRKSTQIWSLNLDSFHLSYSHSQKKVFVSFFFSMGGIKLAA